MHLVFFFTYLFLILHTVSPDSKIINLHIFFFLSYSFLYLLWTYYLVVIS